MEWTVAELEREGGGQRAVRQGSNEPLRPTRWPGWMTATVRWTGGCHRCNAVITMVRRRAAAMRCIVSPIAPTQRAAAFRPTGPLDHRTDHNVQVGLFLPVRQGEIRSICSLLPGELMPCCLSSGACVWSAAGPRVGVNNGLATAHNPHLLAATSHQNRAADPPNHRTVSFDPLTHRQNGGECSPSGPEVGPHCWDLFGSPPLQSRRNSLFRKR